MRGSGGPGGLDHGGRLTTSSGRIGRTSSSSTSMTLGFAQRGCYGASDLHSAGCDNLDVQGLHAPPPDLSTAYPLGDVDDGVAMVDHWSNGARDAGNPIYTIRGFMTWHGRDGLDDCLACPSYAVVLCIELVAAELIACSRDYQDERRSFGHSRAVRAGGAATPGTADTDRGCGRRPGRRRVRVRRAVGGKLGADRVPQRGVYPRPHAAALPSRRRRSCDKPAALDPDPGR